MKGNVNKLGSALLVVCLLIALLPCTAFAESFSMKDIVSESATLSVTASDPGGGTLSYQWYSSTTQSTKGAKPIKGANQASFTAPQTVGTIYYFCSVTSTRDEITSDAVNTTPVAVTFTGSDTSDTDDSSPSASTELFPDDDTEVSSALPEVEEDSGDIPGSLILLVVIISLVVALLVFQLMYVMIRYKHEPVPPEQ